MRRKARILLSLSCLWLTTTNFSCATTVATALRDAAVDGASSFVESATNDLLSGWWQVNAPE